MPPYQIARKGIVRTFQQLRLITRLTVLDNIMLAFQNQAGEQLRNIFTCSKQIKIQEQANRNEAQEILNLLGIREKENALVEDLSYGQQKRLPTYAGTLCKFNRLSEDDFLSILASGKSPIWFTIHSNRSGKSLSKKP